MSVRLWDISDPSAPPVLGDPLTGPKASVTSVAFRPDGQALVAGCADGTVQAWYPEGNGARPGELLPGARGAINSVAFSADGSTLAGGSADQTVVLWKAS